MLGLSAVFISCLCRSVSTDVLQCPQPGTTWMRLHSIRLIQTNLSGLEIQEWTRVQGACERPGPKKQREKNIIYTRVLRYTCDGTLCEISTSSSAQPPPPQPTNHYLCKGPTPIMFMLSSKTSFLGICFF